MIELLASIARIITSLPPAVIVVGFAALIITLMGTTYQYAVVQVGLYVTSLSIFSVGAASDNAVRVVALLLAVLRIMSRGGVDPGNIFVVLGVWRRPVTAFLAMSILSVVWSIHRGDSIVALIGFGILLVVILSLSDNYPVVLRATRSVVLASVALSVPYAASPSAWFRGRLHGIFENANTLGVFALMAAILLYSGWKPRQIPLYLTILVIIIATGSRASGVGAVFGTIAYLVSLRRSEIRRTSLSVLILFAGLVASLFYFASPNSSEILRVKDTRTGVWQSALDMAEGRWLQGVGSGAIGLEAGSSMLRILVELGVIGAAILLFLIVSRVIRSPKAPWQSAMLAALLGNSSFEAWLFTGGSAIFLVFILLTRIPDQTRVSRPAPAVLTVG